MICEEEHINKKSKSSYESSNTERNRELSQHNRSETQRNFLNKEAK